jgi:4-hydroxybenzoate polyprenyltransferase
MFLKRLRLTLEMIRFEHSVFALPFALTGALLAFRFVPLAWDRVAWILVCMVSARSAAMGFNRLVDAAIDARIAAARPVTPEDMLARPLWRRLRDAAARLLLPYL